MTVDGRLAGDDGRQRRVHGVYDSSRECCGWSLGHSRGQFWNGDSRNPVAVRSAATAAARQPSSPRESQRSSSSAPRCQNGFGFHDLVGGAGKAEFEFSGAAGDEDFDGVQSAGEHAEAKLFVDFAESVLLEAMAHAPASVSADPIANLNAGYLRGKPQSGTRSDP